MITTNLKVKKEIQDLVDNRIVSWGLLKWLNQKEAEVRRTFVDMLIVCTLGNENRLLWSVIYFLFRKDLHEILDSSKKVTREALLELVDKIKNYKRTRTKPI